MRHRLWQVLAVVVGFLPSLAQGQDIQTALVQAEVDLMGATTSSATTFFVADLTGAQQNPAVDVSGRGTGAFLLESDGLHFRITVAGLSGPMTAAHFHRAEAGTNGGVVHAITADFDSTTGEGVWGFDGSQPLTDELIGDLLAGRLYVNVHTSANPGGEIRGQVQLASGVGFMARLSGGNEIPARDVSGTGTGAFVLDGDGLHYWVTVSGLTGAVTGSHFHRAAAGANGGVVRAITVEGTTASGVWTATDGQALTAELVGGLLAGGLYVNFHTSQFPGGELRGQVALVSGVRGVVSLNGAQGVPPREVNGAGTAVVTFDGAAVSYRLTASGLTGAITNAHFHSAPAGANGGVVHGVFGNFTGNTASGVWTAADAQPLTPELVQALLAGNLYLNLHTAANPGGEIRGQVVFSPVLVFQALMSGQNENPAVTTQGSGTGGVVWDGDALSYRLTVDGLNAAATNAHFHRAAAGTNGGVVREVFSGFANGTTEGIWAAGDAQPLTSALLSDLMDGGLYLNVHSSAHPGGELRGQIVQPSPTVAGLVVSLSRSIAGQSNAFTWTGTTDANGLAELTLSALDDFRFRRVGASGYYVARVSEPGGRSIGEWGSIPVRGGRLTHLVLPVQQRANITGYSALEAAARPAAVGGESGAYEGPAPALRFAAATVGGTEVTVPIRFERAAETAGGDLLLRYEASALRFGGVRADVSGLVVRETGPGVVEISFDGSPGAGMALVFEGTGGASVPVSLEGVLFADDLFPVFQDLATVIDPGAPSTSALYANYPNPFNPETHIPYDVAVSGRVIVRIYNAIGQRVAQLVDEPQAAGRYRVSWHAGSQASGLYYVQLIAGDFKDIRRMMLIK